MGQSFRKPLYHSCSSWSVNSVFSRRSWSTSGRSLLFCFPILFWVRIQQLQSKRKSAWAPATLGREGLGRGRTLQETEGPLGARGKEEKKDALNHQEKTSLNLASFPLPRLSQWLTCCRRVGSLEGSIWEIIILIINPYYMGNNKAQCFSSLLQSRSSITRLAMPSSGFLHRLICCNDWAGAGRDSSSDE